MYNGAWVIPFFDCSNSFDSCRFVVDPHVLVHLRKVIDQIRLGTTIRNGGVLEGRFMSVGVKKLHRQQISKTSSTWAKDRLIILIVHMMIIQCKQVNFGRAMITAGEIYLNDRHLIMLQSDIFITQLLGYPGNSTTASRVTCIKGDRMKGIQVYLDELKNLHIRHRYIKFSE